MEKYYYIDGYRQTKDLTGQQFNAWTVLNFSRYNERNKRYWLCRCKCEIEKEVEANTLTSGRSRACRKCSAKELAGPKIEKHGLTKGHKKPKVYTAWCAIKTRCYNPKQHRTWKDYGGRGITMCDEWKNSFEAFYEYIGEPPSPYHSIDRINVNGNYEPGNVRWASKSEQTLNRHKSSEWNFKPNCERKNTFEGKLKAQGIDLKDWGH